MIEPLLRSQLEPVTRRQRSWRLWVGLAWCWGAATVLGLLLWFLSQSTALDLTWGLPVLTLAALVSCVGLFLYTSIWEPDYRQLARTIEQSHPDLHALLITAVEQKPDPITGRYHYLQKEVFRQVAEKSQVEPWARAISSRRLLLAHTLHLSALAAFILVITGFERPDAAVPVFSRAERVVVTPGDTVLEKGHGLVVLARFEGGTPPPEAVLVVEEPNQPSRRVPLVRSLDDPLFGGSLPEVLGDLRYRVEYAGRETEWYQVRVFEYPRLERADATLRFPEYTGLPDKEIPDTRRVNAVEGTRLDLKLALNKPVASARLLAKESAQALALDVAADQAIATLTHHVMRESEQFGLELVDFEGRTNKVPALFVLNVAANRRPDLTIAAPKGDQKVSALEEVAFSAETSDDFGVLAYGLTYEVAGQEPRELSLGASVPAREKRPFTHLLPLEPMTLEPRQLISWHLWADDLGPDGQSRRTFSDMYFTEVRPYDEIFRQGQPNEGDAANQGQGQGQGGPATQLLELQKQIINATWKLIRTETASNLSDRYAEDVVVVRDSQEQAIEQTDELRRNVTDVETLQSLETATESMTAASSHLSDAADQPARLPDALRQEQAAYQALLKLAADEFEVSQRQGGQQGSSGGRNQRQLDQLEFKANENRYATQSQASPAQDPQEREQMQVLNRLRELARRQDDLNERLKELQTALQEAQTDDEREEIRRRLKRLREEQQQILADVDELRDRMSRPENQSQMAEAREQLDQTRSQVQQASEALEDQQVSQALASGTRAQRELQELREDFRRQTASQFEEEMRTMRQQARDLAQDQEQIRTELDQLAQERQRRLRDDQDDPSSLAGRLQEQQQGLTNLLDNMKEVSAQAETAEPLLSRQLYDALRRASQSDLEDSLRLAQQLVERKFPEEAAPFEQKAREQIDTLKDSIERAAESVLGGDAEALRLAQEELDELARQVEQELNSISGQGAAGNAGQTNQTQLASRGRNQDPTGGPEDGPPEGADRAQTQLAQAGQESVPPGAGSQDPQGRQGQQGQGQQGQNQQGEGQQGQQAAAGQGQGEQQGESQGQGQQQGEGQGQGQGQGQQTAQNGAQNQEGSRGGARPDGTTGPGGQADGSVSRGGNFFDSNFGSGPGGNEGPLTGPEFSNWSDRLRNVEEVLDQPDLRSEVAQVRDRAREMRAEFKRHAIEPRWDLVRTEILNPLRQVQFRVREELLKLQSEQALVPIDRDPVPARYSDLVRRYYERLGTE